MRRCTSVGFSSFGGRDAVRNQGARFPFWRKLASAGAAGGTNPSQYPPSSSRLWRVSTRLPQQHTDPDVLRVALWYQGAVSTAVSTLFQPGMNSDEQGVLCAVPRTFA